MCLFAHRSWRQRVDNDRDHVDQHQDEEVAQDHAAEAAADAGVAHQAGPDEPEHRRNGSQPDDVLAVQRAAGPLSPAITAHSCLGLRRMAITLAISLPKSMVITPRTQKGCQNATGLAAAAGCQVPPARRSSPSARPTSPFICRAETFRNRKYKGDSF